MPVIDMKDTSIFFEDGYRETGAVNNMAGYAIGVSTIVIDGIVGAIPVNARVSIDGDDRYQVTSTVETSGNTTSITFTPALVAAIADNDVILVYGRFVEIKVGEGSISWSEKKPREYKKDRGLLDQVRNADQEPFDVTMSFSYEYLIASDPMTDPPKPQEILKRINGAASWISSETNDPCAPYSIDIRFEWTPSGCTSPETERVVLPAFRYEQLDFNPKEGTISCSGKCNAVAATVTHFSR